VAHYNLGADYGESGMLQRGDWGIQTVNKE
jgi:hypothetical protein